jgi:hypothetical protein
VEVMALNVGIRAPGAPEALKALDNVEKAGARVAASYTAGWGKASAATVSNWDKAQAKIAGAAAAAAKAAEQAAAASAAATARRAAIQTAAETKLAAHFQQMRQKEISAAENAAYAMQAAYDRQAQASARTTTRMQADAARTANTMTQKYGNAALGIAAALQSIAVSGDLSAGALKNLLTQLSLLAVGFGPQGKLVAAAAVGASAIVDLFTRARTEMEATRKKFDDELALMLNAGDRAGITGKMAALWLGTPAKDFKDGIVSLRDQIAALEPKDLGSALGQALGGGPAGTLKQLKKDLADALAQYEKFERALQRSGSPFRPFNRPAIVTSASTSSAPGMPRSLSGPASVGFSGIGSPGIQGGLPSMGPLSMAFVPPDFGAKMAQPAIAALAEFEGLVSDQVDMVSASIGEGLHRGFAMAFSGEGIAGLFKGFGATVISALGSMMVELGKHLVVFGSIMTDLRAKLTNFFTSGPAALAAGVALIALGSIMTAGAGKIMGGGRAGGGGGGYGGGGYSGGRGMVDTTATYRYNPMTGDMSSIKPGAPVHVTNYNFGVNDPVFERKLSEATERAARRGTV